MKKSQVAIFIVLGIVILIIVILFVMTRLQLAKDVGKREFKQTVPIEAQPVNDKMEKCLEDVGVMALQSAYTRGGYYIFEEGDYYNQQQYFPYYYYQGYDGVPTIEEIEKNIEAYYALQLPYCFEEVLDLPGYRIDIEKGVPVVDAKLQDKKMYVTLSHGVTVTKGDAVLQLDTFKQVIDDVNMNDFHDVSTKIVDNYKQDNLLCLSCIYRWGVDAGMLVDIIDIKPGDTMIVLRMNEKRFRFGIGV